MNKLIPTVVFGLLICPLSANADSSVWSDVNIDGWDANSYGEHISEDQLSSHNVSKSAPLPKRTRMLTGYELEEYDYNEHGVEKLESLIYADGKTKITDNFALRYLFKEIQAYSKGEKVGGEKMHFEIAPRFEKWVSPNFNYAVEFAYEHVSGEGHNTTRKYWIKPEAAFSYGKHFLFVDLETRYLEHDKAYGYESEPWYLYRVTDRFTMGFKVLHVNERNDWNYEERAIKPLIQYRFQNNVYLELRYEQGQYENHAEEGHKYKNFALYSEIPITENFSFLIDAAYRTGEQMNGNQYSWGDREGVFAKLGIISQF